MSNVVTVNGSRRQVPAAVIAKAKPPKEPRRSRAQRQPSARAPQPSVAGTPKPLEVLMQEYQSAFQTCEARLRALGKDEKGMSKEGWSAAQNAVLDPLSVAREALIDAPVATLADVVLKLRFYFEVGDYSWGDQIIKNILRDIDKPGSSALRSSMIDPVIALWEEVLSTEAAYGEAAVDDEAAELTAAEKRMEDAAERFIQAEATTAGGMALKLKYLAHLNTHEKPDMAQTHEFQIVRDLVRYLTGDPNWTIEQETGAKAVPAVIEAVSKPPAPSNSQPARRICAALDVIQTAEIESALNQIVEATNILDDLGGDLLHYCKVQAESDRLAFLSDAIGMYARKAAKILAAAQETEG